MITQYNKLNKYFSNPNWYLENNEILEYIFQDTSGLDNDKRLEVDNERFKVVEYISKLLKSNKVELAVDGEDLDKERKDIKKVVIHHSGSTSLRASNVFEYINAMHMLRLYAPVFKKNNTKGGLWSNHFLKKRMIFFSYHYLIYPSGRVLKALDGKYIGWQAGNWEVNRESIGVCFLGNFIDSIPSAKAIEACNRIIDRYSNVQIIPHYEVNLNATCPGNTFNKWGNMLRSV